MSRDTQPILARLLERLYASLVHGPCLNCRVHRSRQRVDLTSLSALQDLAPGDVLSSLLQENGSVDLKAKAPPSMPPREPRELSLEEKARHRAFEAQSKLMSKLRDIAEDARDYEQETGENALCIGYPILSVPPGLDMGKRGALSSRVLAPLALIPVDVLVRRGAAPSLSLRSKGEGVDLVMPNFPLLAWLEHQTGRDTSSLFEEEEAWEPFPEINEIASVIAAGLQLPAPALFSSHTPLTAVPKADQLPDGPAFVHAAVLGLFPVSNQGLLRDLQAMVDGQDVSGPVEHFLTTEVSQPQPAEPSRADPPTAAPAQPPPLPPGVVPAPPLRNYDQERMVAQADPCQAKAVRFAKEHPILVLHGPPGTGKSQTITNIISDHLSRGERVLLVCDKRTAIDVVRNRLEHLGLGNLCATVYDPQRDQRSLYMSIRQHLEALVEFKTHPRAASGLQKTDSELRSLHRELQGYFRALNGQPGPDGPSFHDLVGQWLQLNPGIALPDDSLPEADLETLEMAEPAIEELLDRARKVDYPANPWKDAAGMTLAAFLSQPAARFRQGLDRLRGEAASLDQTLDPSAPPLFPGSNLENQAAARDSMASLLQEISQSPLRDQAPDWLDQSSEDLRSMQSRLESLHPCRSIISAAPLDAELSLTLAGTTPAPAQVNNHLGTLDRYLKRARKWFGFLFWPARSAARQVLDSHGLPLDPNSADRLRTFLQGVKARLICQEFLAQHARHQMPDSKGSFLPDRNLQKALDDWGKLWKSLASLSELPGLDPLKPRIREALTAETDSFPDSLRASARRARAMHALLEQAQQTAWFDGPWLTELRGQLCQHQPAEPPLTHLLQTLDTLESVLRLHEQLPQLPPSLQDGLRWLLQKYIPPHEGLETLRKHLLARTISERIRHDPTLQQIDQDRLQACFDRYRKLETKKREQVRDAVLHQWISLQQEKLLASTRTQLNGAGAALKRRLITRGKRSMKIRQMILHGAKSAEPDPLFDVCPVWMASPSTVAQIFPRLPLFDVLIFDEASQCRLEEAVPVLTRGKRVVIAGDPKQLPPTRFFEAAFVDTDEEELETDQDLFEWQQTETEDLLGAALNIQVQQSYLDVHYRSRHEALIGFSNRNFYHNRLQPIPGHPSRKGPAPPIELLRADGLYEKRSNLREAETVTRLVKELLNRRQPPSIGIACFNLVQRDLVLDKLEEAVEQDAQFAARYESARNRRGKGSFEGLFVKNLENVQGDERDHIIICTTFGPDAQGKFRRNFGPLGRQGGGRRLNVLVTRAREKIHLITSIPRPEYATLPALDEGQTPSGRWLLYAYLHYAEELALLHQKENERLDHARQNPGSPGQVNVHPAHPQSQLSQCLAEQLARFHNQHSDVFWGNDGFCVDIALHHPSQPEQVTLGVLCDMNRFTDAEDPVDWEMFRTAILEHNGWNFHRVWSPGLFLDPEKHRQAILQTARQAAV